VSDSTYEDETHASDHADGGADEIARGTEGVTTLELTNADTTPRITDASDEIVRVVESNSNGLITDFVDADGDHSAFTVNDWFDFLLTDAGTSIKFSENANIEGNVGTDLTGSATQFMKIRFTYDGTRFISDLSIGLSNATTTVKSVLN
jgi:hypothetical protein